MVVSSTGVCGFVVMMVVSPSVCGWLTGLFPAGRHSDPVARWSPKL
jgi:hypothetical protein